MNRNVKKYLVLVFALVLSFYISSFLTRNVFIAQSKQINWFFLSNLRHELKANWNNFVARARGIVPGANNRTIEQVLKESARAVAPGVRASSYENYSYAEIELNNVIWVVIEYTDAQGQKKQIQVPKGMEHLYR